MKDDTPQAHGLDVKIGKVNGPLWEPNDLADLPTGSSKTGMTSNSLGKASMADLETGFSDGEYANVLPIPDTDDGTTANDIDDDWAKTRGFLDRPEGWER